MDEKERTERFRTVYRSVQLLGDVDPAAGTPAVASLRLLLIDAVGEERQRELIGEWNNEHRSVGTAGADAGTFRRLAQEGIAFAFVSAGMPLAWARRHTHLFQYMPPVHAPLDEHACAELRAVRRAAGEWAPARNAGNMLLALAVLEANAMAIQEHAAENLSILDEWRTAEPDLGRDYEFEVHTWLRDHAAMMADWGRSARRHLDVV